MQSLGCCENDLIDLRSSMTLLVDFKTVSVPKAYSPLLNAYGQVVWDLNRTLGSYLLGRRLSAKITFFCLGNGKMAFNYLFHLWGISLYLLLYLGILFCSFLLNLSQVDIQDLDPLSVRIQLAPM